MFYVVVPHRLAPSYFLLLFLHQDEDLLLVLRQVPTPRARLNASAFLSGPAGCAWILRKSSEHVTIPLRALREVLSMPSIEGTLASRAADVARRRFFRDEVGTRK